eukprot:15324995-Alexandrium_andersonii.AAC.1
MSSGPKIHPEGRWSQAHPTGHTALSVAPSRRKSENPLLHCQGQEAPRAVRRLLRMDLRNGGLRLSLTRSRGED